MPPSNGYAADTNTIAAWKEAAHVVNRSIPGNPVAPIADLAIEGIAAVVASASLLYARKKNTDATAHASAADTLAELVVRSGLATQALQVASVNGSMPAVAKHIDANTLAELAPK